MAGWSEALQWDPSVLDAEATANARNAATLTSHSRSILGLRPPVWFGTAADRSRQDARLMLHRVAGLAELLERQASCLESAADDLRRLKADQASLGAEAGSRQFRIDQAGLVVSIAPLPAALDPRRAWWFAELTGAVLAIAWRTNQLDIALAVKLSKLAVDDLAHGAQERLIGLANSGFAGAQDALSAANQWLVGAAGGLWPDAAGPLAAWQRGSESFMGEAARQPRWLQDLLYTGRLPDAAEVIGHGTYLAMHAVGDSTGGPFFNDGSPYLPRLRDTVEIAPPASLAGLVSNMNRPYNTSDPDDRTDRPAVEVSVVASEPPRFIVNIPGTSIPLNRVEGWTGDVEGADWPADVKGIGFGDSSVTQSTKAAIDLALRTYEAEHGVTVERPHLLLSGHSQGGIIAANIASDPAFTGRYRVDGIVAAGSPLNTIEISPEVPVINFHHTTDIVPKLDLGGGGDQPNVTEVHLPTRLNPGAAHGVDGYAADIEARTAVDPRIREAEERLAPYLSGPDRLRTYQFDVGRN